MLSKTVVALTAFLSAGAGLVAAHGTITEVNGANGVTGAGFGIDPSTPRDGSARDPFQQDTSIIRDREIRSGQVSGCGRTALETIDIDAEMADAIAAGMPTAAADGTVSMTLHQVNQDGAGPYECDISADGTGEDFQPMRVTTQVPGRDTPVIGSLSRATATPFPLEAQIPAGTTCTGGGSDVCLVRCRNSAIAGPFGSCAAVSQGTANSAANNKRTLSTEEGKEAARLMARDFLKNAMAKRSRVAGKA